MGMYIQTPEGEWIVIGELSGEGVTFVRDPEPEVETPARWKTKRFIALDESNSADTVDDSSLHSLTGPRTMEFEFKLSKWGYIDFLMLMLGMTRKEARKHTGRKPLLKNGKAWR